MLELLNCASLQNCMNNDNNGYLSNVLQYAKQIPIGSHEMNNVGM